MDNPPGNSQLPGSQNCSILRESAGQGLISVQKTSFKREKPLEPWTSMEAALPFHPSWPFPVSASTGNRLQLFYFYFPPLSPLFAELSSTRPKIQLRNSETPRAPRKEEGAGVSSRSSAGTKVILCIIYLSWKMGFYSGYPRIQVLKPTLSQQHLE